MFLHANGCSNWEIVVTAATALLLVTATLLVLELRGVMELQTLVASGATSARHGQEVNRDEGSSQEQA